MTDEEMEALFRKVAPPGSTFLQQLGAAALIREVALTIAKDVVRRVRENGAVYHVTPHFTTNVDKDQLEGVCDEILVQLESLGKN